MPLGVELNSIAPSLIANNGQALVQGIRQLGQQISGHLTEIQTKRDLASMAQDLQGANVQSADFPIQLAQVASRHPMAIRDERGQMAMSLLGKAHGQWQAEEADARAFNRAMALQGYRSRNALAIETSREKARNSRPIVTPGGLYDPALPVQDPLGEETMGGIVPGTEPAAKTVRPINTPQGLYDPATKAIIPGTGPSSKGMTPSQQATNDRMRDNSALQSLHNDLKSIDTEVLKRQNAIRNLITSKAAIKDAAAAASLQAQMDEEQKAINDLLEKRKPLHSEIESRRKSSSANNSSLYAPAELPSTVANPVDPLQEGSVIPVAVPAGASVLPAMDEIPTVMTVLEAQKLPKGTQFKSPDGKIRIAQ